MKANFPGVELSRKIFRFKKRKRNSSSYVDVFDITWNEAIQVVVVEWRSGCRFRSDILNSLMVAPYKEIRLVESEIREIRASGIRILGFEI